MTTLILLCLVLIGAGVLLFASQVRAQIVGGLSLKLLCLVMIGCMILPVAQVQADKHKYEPIPLRLLDTTKIEEYKGEKAAEELYKLRSTVVSAMLRARLFMVNNCYASYKPGAGQYVPPMYPGVDLSFYVHTTGQCGDAYDDYVVALALLKKWDAAMKEWNAAMSTREIRRDAKQKIAALKDKLKSKQFCDVVLEGTILLREVQDHNERGLGTKGEAARIPDGELHGIIEVAKQGCNPE